MADDDGNGRDVEQPSPEDEARKRQLEEGKERADEIRFKYRQRKAELVEEEEAYELNDTIRIRLNSTIKEMWQEAVEKSQYSSLSELVRISVEKELSGRYDSQENQNEQVLEAVLAVKDEVEDTQREIQQARRDIVDEDRLNSVLESAMDSVVRRSGDDG